MVEERIIKQPGSRPLVSTDSTAFGSLKKKKCWKKQVAAGTVDKIELPEREHHPSSESVLLICFGD